MHSNHVAKTVEEHMPKMEQRVVFKYDVLLEYQVIYIEH